MDRLELAALLFEEARERGFPELVLKWCSYQDEPAEIVLSGESNWRRFCAFARTFRLADAYAKLKWGGECPCPHPYPGGKS